MALQPAKRVREEDQQIENQDRVPHDAKRPRTNLRTVSTEADVNGDIPDTRTAGHDADPIDESNSEVLTYMGLQSVQQAISGLDDSTIRSIVTRLALENSAVAAVILSNYRLKWERECAEVIDFDRYSKSVWHELNSYRGDHWYTSPMNDSFKIAENVKNTITLDIEERVKVHSNFATKRSALETLRKIGKTICLSTSDTGDDVAEAFIDSSELDSAMVNILKTMQQEEKAMMADAADGQYLEKLDELERLGDECEIFDGVKRAARLIRKAMQSQYGETEIESSEDSSEDG